MDLKAGIRIAFVGLKTKKTRTFLTMLGIIIGISSVIIIISVGNGAQSLILNQIRSMGSNLIAIFPGASEAEGPPPSVFGNVITTLKNDDIEALEDKKNLPDAVAVTSFVRGVGTLQWRSNQAEGTFVGTTASYTEVHDAGVEFGRFFDIEDEKNLAKVVVLGYDMKNELFGDNDALGSNIKIKKQEFKVIGVMQKRGIMAFENQDKLVFIPVTTAQKILLGIDYVSLARVKVNVPENADRAIEDIKYILRDKHNLKSGELDDFTVSSQAQAIKVFSSITDSLTYFLAAIAAISLLVGGIGIMNIMLIAVSERTREIGLRKALGAKNKNIMSQFLFESIVITFASGVIGIILGVAVSFMVSFIAQKLGYNWDFVVSVPAVFLSCAISILVGLVFGLYPAWRASKLHPIEALHYE